MTDEQQQFLTILDMRARLMSGGFNIMMAFDRIACPIPSPDNKSAILMKTAAQDILKWSQTLPAEEQKSLQSMMSSHIKDSVNYLKQAQKTVETVES